MGTNEDVHDVIVAVKICFSPSLSAHRHRSSKLERSCLSDLETPEEETEGVSWDREEFSKELGVCDDRLNGFLSDLSMGDEGECVGNGTPCVLFRGPSKLGFLGDTDRSRNDDLSKDVLLRRF